MRLRLLVLLLVVLPVIALSLPAFATAAGVTLTPNEQLGKSAFFDADLSVNHNQSCATCHGPDAGWTGPDTAINAHGGVYEGSIPGAFGDRKPPSSAYATFAPVLHLTKKGDFVGGNFWDGRATGEKLGNPAADQAQGPFLNPKEQALADPAHVVYRVATGTSPEYPYSFAFVWGWDPATEIDWPDPMPGGDQYVLLDDADRAMVHMAYDQIALSIAAYEASPESNAFSSKFDGWRSGKAAFTQPETKGFALFMGKGKCAKCHTATGKNPLFTDYTYDNLGLPKNPENPATIADPSWADPGLGGFLGSRYDYAPFADENMGKHKVPTLRNVAKGAGEAPDGIVKAYGHNGYFKSLEDIVHFYNMRDLGGWPEPEVAENVNTAELGNLGLTAQEEADIVAFLKTLSDGYLAP